MPEKTLLRQTLINYVQYNEYQLDDEQPRPTGEFKTELEIRILKRDVDTQNLLTAWKNQYSTENIFLFDRVRFTFGFEITLMDDGSSIISSEPYEFELDSIEDIDELTVITVDCESPEDKLVLKMNLNGDDSPYVNLACLTCNCCKFVEGFRVSDRENLIVTLNDCEIYDFLESIETRPKKKATAYTMLNRCEFSDLRAITIDKIAYFTMAQCRVVTTPYGTDDIGEITSPNYIFANCKEINIDRFNLGNLLAGLQVSNNEIVTVSFLSGHHVDLKNPLQVVLGITGSDEVTVSGCDINGINITDCKKVCISNINPTRMQVQNSDYLVRVVGATESVSIADVNPDMNVAKSPIQVSMCSAETVGICSCKFEYESNPAITLIANEGSVSITDCVFTKLKLCVKTDTISKSLRIIDCVFDSNDNIVSASTVEALDFVGCTISGKKSDTINDFKLAFCNNVRFIDTFFRFINASIEDCGTCEFKESQIINSRLKTLRTNVFSKMSLFESPTKDGGYPSTTFESGDNISLNETEFRQSSPSIKGFSFLNIVYSRFKTGLIVENSGGIGSQIKGCEFGDSSDNNLYRKGIHLKSCNSTTISENRFYAEEKTAPSILEMQWCSVCVFDESNTFPNKSQVAIENGELSFNNNVFIVDTTKIERPSISTPSNYGYMLYLFNKPKYEEQYSGIKAYDTIEEVMNLKANMVAYVDPNETWVKPFLAKVKSNLNVGYSNI